MIMLAKGRLPAEYDATHMAADEDDADDDGRNR